MELYIYTAKAQYFSILHFLLQTHFDNVLVVNNPHDNHACVVDNRGQSDIV